jgi:hypothetical protein
MTPGNTTQQATLASPPPSAKLADAMRGIAWRTRLTAAFRRVLTQVQTQVTSMAPRLDTPTQTRPLQLSKLALRMLERRLMRLPSMAARLVLTQAMQANPRLPQAMQPLEHAHVTAEATASCQSQALTFTRRGSHARPCSSLDSQRESAPLRAATLVLSRCRAIVRARRPVRFRSDHLHRTPEGCRGGR